MTWNLTEVETIREALSSLPDVAAQENLNSPSLSQIYVPVSHQRALKLDTTVVVGMRGSGKSLWTAVLFNRNHRQFVANSWGNQSALAKVDVRIGFGLDPTNIHCPSEGVLGELVKQGYDATVIWQAVVLLHALETAGIKLPFARDWSTATQWVSGNVAKVGTYLNECDRVFATKGTTLLIVFDAMDRLASTWENIRQLMTGALQVALQCRAFSTIRMKFFLRPDMVEDEAIWQFRDSSKLAHSKVELSWPTVDLYGLIFMHLINRPDSGPIVRKFIGRLANVKLREQNEQVYVLPRAFVTDERLREAVKSIAGEWMGKNWRRGASYTWIPTHLADAALRVSPRSVLLAFKRAAEITTDQYAGHDKPLHYEAIKEGVIAASAIRVSEIKEDYPWVKPLLEAARGLVVPCFPKDLTTKWTSSCLREVAQANQKLPPRRFSTDPYRRGRHEALVDDLVELAVLYRTEDARLNMPDIFRVGVGIKRKGGVKPPR